MGARDGRRCNREPRTANREPRTANREPRTANREPSRVASTVSEPRSVSVRAGALRTPIPRPAFGSAS
ncbi:hypothetical protein E9998_01535 [Glycomyces paridis]|uniref:Uncharacterized protein n=1 Tax=Glycomyces paridis TaxID=2126555 RepID=A0A4S8PR18_9ACTN|nr:hypothetical protein E9998_01535 [Glycomyces paridis]